MFLEDLFSYWNSELFFHVIPGDMKSDNMAIHVCRSFYFMSAGLLLL